MDKKRLQNKLSQRKHRAKQQQKVKELEEKCEYLTEKLNNCLYNNKSNQELAIIYNNVINRMGKINSDVSELKQYLDVSVFAALKKEKKHTPLSIMESDTDDGDEEDELNISTNDEQIGSVEQDFLYKNFTIDYALPRSPSSTTFLSNPTFDSQVINSIGVQFITTINNTNESNAVALIDSPSVINMVCSYANEIFEKIPELQHYTFAYGGVKWLCGQILLCCLTNPKLESIHSILFNPYSELYSKLYSSLETNLTKWLNSKNFNNSTDLILTNLNEYDNFYSILHQFFHPTTLQKYLLKQSGSKYPYWINFIIWPEFRDCILSNLDELNDDILKSQIFGELLINVVLVINDDELCTDGKPKLFQMKNVSKILEFSVNYLKTTNSKFGQDIQNLEFPNNSTFTTGDGITMNFKPTIQYLSKFGLFNPFYWKLSKSYGEKFRKVVPSSLVIWDIDDKNEDNLLKVVFT